MEEKEVVLSVKDLHISFTTDHGIVHAVRGVSFDLIKGETLCIVGESGSGKSVTSKTIMGILSANARIEKGSVIYQGEDLVRVSEEEFHRIRGHQIGMIFQDPLSSLNPIVRIGKQITEATLINRNILKRKYKDLIAPELIACKNHTNNLDYEIEGLEFQLQKYKDECLKDIEKKVNAPELSKDEAKALKVQLNKEFKESFASKKKATNDKIKKLKLEYKESHPALEKALAEKKKIARKEVKDFYKALVEETEAKLLDLKNKIKELEELGTDIEENAAKIKEINEQITLIKQDFINKTKITKAEAKRQALEVMKEVGIPFPEKRFRQYPFEFSGGMRQRIVIAIALTANPEILICDEPTTALDVTIQAQILELINRLKAARNMSCIFITHDLGVVANMADRVAVMYAGKIVEYGTSNEVFYDPRHPYTWALLSSIPDIDTKEKIDAIPGTPPNMIYPPKGDAFALRSKYAMNIDFEYEPPLFKITDTHYAATWLLAEGAPKVEMPKIVSERIKKSLEEANKNE